MVYIIIFSLIGIVLVQDIGYRQERKDLYSRIMARDLTEYKAGTHKTIPNIIRKNTSDELKRKNSPIE